jgi:hypothetical protein
VVQFHSPPTPPSPGGSGNTSGGGGSRPSQGSCRAALQLVHQAEGRRLLAAPQGRVASLNGSLGLIGGQTGALSIVVNYTTGQVSGFATGGLQAGWNGAAAASISDGYIWGNLGQTNAGFSGRTVSGFGSGPVLGGYGSFGDGIRFFGATAGMNLMGGAGGGANFTFTSRPFQFPNMLGDLLKDPFDYVLSAARAAACRP